MLPGSSAGPIWIMAKPPTDLVTVTLVPAETLSGRVTHSDGRPAAGIVVSASGQGPGNSRCNRSASTDTDGRYAMDVTSEHAYVVRVDNRQWAAPYRADVLVRAGNLSRMPISCWDEQRGCTAG